MGTTPLTISHYVPDGSGPPLRPDITVGERLRQVAAEVPDRTAMVEGIHGGGRRWFDHRFH